MDQENIPGETAPMHKQEIVKEDGRTLIYYTFADEDSAPQNTDETPEAAHV